ncbi:MAG TPA: hypothetical protein VNJ46_02715, partial [Gaiellaceae bacterium]|nr:hypothetical protein [Gaiellaceae bacterium]
MSETVTGGLALALGSAAALNWGFFRQHVAASSLPRLSVSRPVFSLGLLFRNPSWLSGFVAGLVGWALYVAALRLAPLSLVQAVSAGGIGVLALLVTRTGTVRLARRERLGVAAALGGLAALGLSLAGGSTHGGRGSWLGVTLWAALSVAWAGLAAGPLSGRLAGGAGFGVAAGSLYAAGDVATKAAVCGGAATLFVLLVLACHGLAFACLQLGFQRGSALATAGLSTLFTNALPIVAGMALFGERLPGGALGVLRGLSFVAVVVGAAALARSERH